MTGLRMLKRMGAAVDGQEHRGPVAIRRGQQEPLPHGLPGRIVFHIVVGAENS